MYEDVDSGLELQSENNRKEVRWSIPVPVILRGTLAHGTAFEEEGATEDVSPSGMAIFLPMAVKRGDKVEVAVRGEAFTASAVVTSVHSMGPNLHRVRVRFEGFARYDRSASPRKYLYDTSSSSWSGYIEDGVYYSRKHDAIGKADGGKIISLDTNQDLFVRKGDSFYDLRGNFLGRLV